MMQIPRHALETMDKLPGKVKIVEVGPRDGLQNESKTVPIALKLELIRQLGEAGLRHIEAGSFVHPKWVPQMTGSDKVLKTLIFEQANRTAPDDTMHYPVLVPNLKGLENAIAAGAKEIAVFAAASERFSEKNINCSINESIKRFEALSQPAIEAGLRIRGYISCVLGCPYEGSIDPIRVVDVAQALSQIGCYEISLGDTIGVGTPHKVIRLIESISKKIPLDQLAVHFHDTYGQAIGNIYAALQCGVKTIDSSVAGLGGCPYAKGAGGNVATEDVLYLLDGLGIKHGVNLGKLAHTGRFICDYLNKPIMSRVNLAIGSND